MRGALRQGTAAILKLGPFVDDTDFKTLETGLTIAQGDIQISKNGGAFAQTSESSPVTTHDSGGWYPVPLTATDTNTVGRIWVRVQVSGALPIWWEGIVLAANVYDALVAGSDNLQVDTVQVEGGDATDALAAAVSGYDGPTKAEMDAAFTEIKGATFDTSTDSLEAIRNRGDAAWLSGAGEGAITYEYTLTSSVDATPIDDALVEVYTEAAMTNKVAQGRTDAFGNVTFYLDAGTYYFKQSKSGWTFTNPKAETVE